MIRIKYESNLNICIKYKKLNCSELILAGLSVFLKCFCHFNSVFSKVLRLLLVRALQIIVFHLNCLELSTFTECITDIFALYFLVAHKFLLCFFLTHFMLTLDKYFNLLTLLNVLSNIWQRILQILDTYSINLRC